MVESPLLSKVIADQLFERECSCGCYRGGHLTLWWSLCLARQIIRAMLSQSVFQRTPGLRQFHIISKTHRQLVFFLSLCLLWNPSFVYSWFIEHFPQTAWFFPLCLVAVEPQFCIQLVHIISKTHKQLVFFLSLSACWGTPVLYSVGLSNHLRAYTLLFYTHIHKAEYKHISKHYCLC